MEAEYLCSWEATPHRVNPLTSPPQHQVRKYRYIQSLQRQLWEQRRCNSHFPAVLLRFDDKSLNASTRKRCRSLTILKPAVPGSLGFSREDAISCYSHEPTESSRKVNLRDLWYQEYRIWLMQREAVLKMSVHPRCEPISYRSKEAYFDPLFLAGFRGISGLTTFFVRAGIST